MTGEKPYYLYILRCGDGTLYTGVSPDPERRLREHSAGRGAKYTRGRGPLSLVYTERCADRAEALRREIAVKRLSRKEKLRLIGGAENRREGPVNTTLCYLENGRGEYLMLHRVKKENDINRDKWLGVGGKTEPGESPEECLVREVREETELTLTDFRFRGVVTFVQEGGETEYMFLFTSDRWTGEMRRDCDEGVLEWVPRERVPELPIWEGDKIFFRLLDEGKSGFLLKLEYDKQGGLVRAALDGAELPLRE